MEESGLHFFHVIFFVQNFLTASCGNKKAGDEGHLVQQSSKLGQKLYKIDFKSQTLQVLSLKLYHLQAV